LIDTFAQMADHMVNTQGGGACAAGHSHTA
jgi:hypothetical protein